MQVDLSKYIGIPYKLNGRPPAAQLDCWGFVVKLFKQEFDYDLPTYAHIDAETPSDSSYKIFQTDLYKQAQVVTDVKPFDLLIFKAAGLPIHIAIAIDENTMIHCDRKVGVVVEDYRRPKWSSRLHEALRLDITISS